MYEYLTFVIRNTASFIFLLPSPHLHKHPDAASHNVLAFSITFSLRGTYLYFRQSALPLLATKPYHALNSIISHHPLASPPRSLHWWVSKAPSLMVISVLVFPSFPASHCWVCGLGVQHVYLPIDTDTQ